MKQFYKNRLNRHQSKLIRYLKYVFNDHIVLVSTFLLGGFGLYYSNIVKSLDADFVFGKPIVLVIWLITLLTGRLATLMQEADTVFLLPKENEMTAYLTASFQHSLVLPASLLLLVTGITMPLLIAVNQATVTDFVFYLGMLLLLKMSQLLQQFHGIYLANQEGQRTSSIAWLGLSLAALASALYLAPWLGLSLAVILFAYQVSLIKKVASTKNLDWETMISTEQQRMKRIYQFINLFTDVPGISGKVKRRKWLDPLLVKIPLNHNQTFYYLYTRSFIRGNEYSGLFMRLIAVGVIILVFLNDFLLVLAVSLIVVYLIGFQLLPIYGQFDYMVMTNLYPLPVQQKKRAVSQLIRNLLLITSFLFGLIALLVLPDIKNSLIVIAALALETLLFTYFYVPKRLKKMSRF